MAALEVEENKICRVRGLLQTSRCCNKRLAAYKLGQWFDCLIQIGLRKKMTF